MERRLYFFALLTILPIFAFGSNCQQARDVLARLGIEKLKTSFNENHKEVSIDFKITDWDFQLQKNKLKADGFLVLKWKNPSFDFSQLNSCRKTLRLPLLTVDSSLFNLLGVPENRALETYDLNIDGTIVASRRYEALIPCSTSSEAYPFGNTTCSWKIHADDVNINWERNGTEKMLESPLNAGSLSLRDFLTVSSSEELSLTLIFSQNAQDFLIHFYIPSLLFLIPPLLSLLLGPMAITRCCLLMTSLILLSLHYHTNNPILPQSIGVSAISVWKLFSYLFVIGIVVELVIITLLASIGRSRTCCLSKNRSGRYEMEPLYEEMNDLRQRKTRKTRNCCRVTALVFDMASFVFFGAALVLFCYGYYADRNSVVKLINEFEIESLHFL